MNNFKYIIKASYTKRISKNQYLCDSFSIAEANTQRQCNNIINDEIKNTNIERQQRTPQDVGRSTIKYIVLDRFSNTVIKTCNYLLKE